MGNKFLWSAIIHHPLSKVKSVMKNQGQLILEIKSNPETVEFQDVINYIDQHYQYTPTEFRNGVNAERIINRAGENEGSCKIFSFALLNKLDKIQTLNCFGHYYRRDVLDHPHNTDHSNIRNFIKYGWEGITFNQPALRKRDPR